MNNKLIQENTQFDKIQNIKWGDDGSTLIEFLESVIFKYPVMLPDVSNIYVLVADKQFPTDNFREDQKKLLENNEKYVMGYIWLSKHYTTNNYNCNFINFIDTRVRGLNIAKYMIEQYESIEMFKILLPLEIMKGAQNYWKRYFESVFDVKTNADLNELLLDFNVEIEELEELDWHCLREILP